MKHFLRFIVRTIVAGVLFLTPLLLLIVVIQQAVRIVAKILDPIASRLPLKPAFGMDRPEVAAALLLLAIAFAAGLIAQAGIAARINRAIEQLILRRMPGYTLIKSIAQSATGLGDGGDVKPCLANIDDAWLIGFIIEQQHGSGMLTVFIPSAPTPTAGSLYYLTEPQVKRLDVPVSTAMKCIMQLGVGSRQLLDKAKFS